MDVMAVPSDDNLLLDVKMQTADVDFVPPGFPTTIKLDAYDYSVYGTISGVGTYLSADTVSDEVCIGAKKPYFKVHMEVTGRNFVGKASEGNRSCRTLKSPGCGNREQGCSTRGDHARTQVCEVYFQAGQSRAAGDAEARSIPRMVQQSGQRGAPGQV